MKQRTDEWHAARLGKLTASRIADALATIKSGAPSASRARYRTELALERITGKRADAYTSAEMIWGVDVEAEARDFYGLLNDIEVEELGFIDHPQIAMTGASPDGAVGVGGLVEFKCPASHTHVDYLVRGTAAIDGKYMKQMHWQMICAGANWCDFVSYDPRMPANARCCIMRIDRPDPPMVMEMEQQAREFLLEVDTEEAFLKAYVPRLRGKALR